MKRLMIRVIVAVSVMLLMLSLLAGCGGPKETEIVMMTQNLRIGSSEDGADNEVFLRSDRFIALLKTYQPDVVGLQEYTDEWDFMLADYLEESDYELVLQYRSTADREGTPILYNAKRLKLISSNHWWLSDTPEVESPSWDDGEGRRCRIVTECVFEEKESGIRFVHLNTHFGLTAYAQDESAALLLKRVREKYPDMPLFATADYNCTEGSNPYMIMTEGGSLLDSRYLATETGNLCGTFNGFEKDQYGPVIDIIFVSPSVETTYYSVLTDRPEDGFVSDHFGVLTKNILRKD